MNIGSVKSVLNLVAGDGVAKGMGILKQQAWPKKSR